MGNEKIVAIVVNHPSEPPPIEVIPPLISLHGGSNSSARHKLSFRVINNRDEDLSDVKVTFPAGTTPFEGSDQYFDTGEIDSGESDTTQKRRARQHSVGDHRYKYTVTVTVATGTSPPPLDPQVVISNGGGFDPKRGKKRGSGNRKKPKARKSSKK